MHINIPRSGAQPQPFYPRHPRTSHHCKLLFELVYLKLRAPWPPVPLPLRRAPSRGWFVLARRAGALPALRSELRWECQRWPGVLGGRLHALISPSADTSTTHTLEVSGKLRDSWRREPWPPLLPTRSGQTLWKTQSTLGNLGLCFFINNEGGERLDVWSVKH